MSRIREIKGVLSILGGLYTCLALVTHHTGDSSFFTFSSAGIKNAGGIVGAYLSDLILTLLGLPGFLIPLFLCISGVRRLMAREGSLFHLAGGALLTLALSLLIQLPAGTMGLGKTPGGFVGGAASGALTSLLTPLGAAIVAVALIIISVILLSPVPLSSYAMARWAEKKAAKPRKERMARRPRQEEKDKPKLPEKQELVITREQRPEPLALKKAEPELPAGETPQLAPRERSEGYTLPSLSFLMDAEGAEGPTKEELSSAAANLEKKLADFGVNGRIRTAHPGPVVTMYEFEPAPGVKITRIVSLSDDLALALRAPSIRVYPIAGKAAIGLEVPNRKRATVSFKEVVASEPFRKGSSLLTLALGKDIFGN
ncbi:MAG: hypothetical protein HGA78_03240, partial [Nitrospirales bacterium]|nr:hypothetical protein [Nitrospirales bacterium]